MRNIVSITEIVISLVLIATFVLFVCKRNGSMTIGFEMSDKARSLQTATSADTAIKKCIDYLYQNQVKKSTGRFNLFHNYAGNWPQHMYFPKIPFVPKIPEVSPFIPSFIHHALSFVTAGNQVALSLTDHDIMNSKEIRSRAAQFMRNFITPENQPGSGTIGFWPKDAYPRFPGLILETIFKFIVPGPIFGGNRSPLNLALYPNYLNAPSDGDDTACVYSSLFDDVYFDGGLPLSYNADVIAEFFSDWRDLGELELYNHPDWVPEASGAFLQLTSYVEPGQDNFMNDFDVVMNVDILFFLGRFNKLEETPGVTEAITLVNKAVTELGLHRGDDKQFKQLSPYYPKSNVFQYFVSRAYKEAGVVDLWPSVNILMEDLQQSVIDPGDGTAFWDLGEPPLNTAYAVLTLLNGGSNNTELIEKAVNYLVQQQYDDGSFKGLGYFFYGELGNFLLYWVSKSFSVALVLEALARWKITTSSSHY